MECVKKMKREKNILLDCPFCTGVLNKLLSDENTNKNQMDSMKVDTKRAQNQFTTKSYLLVFGRY